MIATGQLQNQLYEVHRLTPAHVPVILQLQQEVVDTLDHPAILAPLSEDELLYILNGHGMMIGIFIEEELIAFRALLEPEHDEEHLGLDIGLKQGELSQVLYQEISNVHPRYRGHGLQRKMADYIMSQVDAGNFPIICATVMPFNIASLKDKFGQGMYIAALKLKYGGKLRYVFTKNLVEPVAFENVGHIVAMDDTILQQKLLKEGFFGVEMKKTEEKWSVLYKKIRN